MHVSAIFAAGLVYGSVAGQRTPAWSVPDSWLATTSRLVELRQQALLCPDHYVGRTQTAGSPLH